MIFPLYSHDFPPSVSFPIARQADATEFSALLLDWLQRELSASWEPRKNAVFLGVLRYNMVVVDLVLPSGK